MWGGLLEGCGSNDLSSLHCVELCHCGVTLWIGLMQWRVVSQAPGQSCHTGSPWSHCASDRSGVGRGHRGESNRPLAPWHPPPHRPVIPCSRGMIICMTELGAFVASDYDSPWQRAFLVHCLMLLLIWWQRVLHSCRRECVVAFHK